MSDNTSIQVSNYQRIQAAFRDEKVISRFGEVVGNSQAGAYIASAMIAVNNSEYLKKCTPVSIIGSALRSAALRLSCDPSTGHAYLVPFKDQCTLIVGYKGLMQMALRTGKYRFINVATIWEGQVIDEDQMTGAHRISGGKTGPKHIGHLLYFELVRGYQKTFYMTVEEIHAHAKRFSKTYGLESSFWQRDTISMEKKTVLRLGLSKWGYFDPHDSMMLDSSPDDENTNPELAQQVAEAEYVEPEHHTEEQNMDALGF